MFSLFEITDKGSSWIGPLFGELFYLTSQQNLKHQLSSFFQLFTVSLIFSATRSMRLAIIYVVVVLLAPLFILRNIDMVQGIKDAKHIGVLQRISIYAAA